MLRLASSSRTNQTGGQRRSFHYSGDLLGVAHPPQQVADLRFAAKQMGQNPTRCIGKESLFELLLRAWQLQWRRPFHARTVRSRNPRKAPLIERIEDQIAPFWTVELLDELARRVVNNAQFSPCFDLPEDLLNCIGFTASGVAHE